MKAFQEAEEMLNRQERYYAAAGLSMRMQAALDRESLRRKRRENYQVLLDELRDCPGVRPLFPELTEDRRKELAKDVKKKGDAMKVAIRNIRRDAMEAIKKAQKAGEISEDDNLMYRRK